MSLQKCNQIYQCRKLVLTFGNYQYTIIDDASGNYQFLSSFIVKL